MASTKLVYMRRLFGRILTEVAVENSDADLILTNVVLLEVGRDWCLFNQGGSGGLGTIWVPTRNIVGIII
ncbi:hypothetical protein [Pseudalkalibacillus salsuginis]|uniref:hypothetical protein n=1 Tax=Pseudalkalibacillus salsuginis TaxID=2910972 RepID=UPI001F1A3175|nr:hypothetical protein [Pseudalkalibacillus salsuginis]MCF6409162.1 hypothetical protein [Pseudalkalibacillus salsuginis]